MNQLRGYYEAEIDGTPVGFRFNTNCFRLYSEMHGLELAEIDTIIGTDKIRDLIWCAGKTCADLQGKEWSFTLLEIEDWIDYADDTVMEGMTRALNSTKIFGQEIRSGSEPPKN
ncbi:MAG: hypothetical protein WC359_13385 [Dehalococcoidia bacterium]|jgi:hypothetical protein